MGNPLWVVVASGVPTAEMFASARGQGSPIIINGATGLAYYMNASGSVLPLGGSAIGITDHGALTGLADDDHVNYLNTTRADALYAPLGHVGSGGTSEHDLATEFTAGFLDPNDKVILNDISDHSWTWMELGVDFSTISETPDASPLAFTPLASKSYAVEGHLLLETSDNSVGPLLTIEFPTDVSRGLVSLKAATSPSSEIVYHGIATDPASLAVSPMSANTPLPAYIQISFTTGASPVGDFSVSLCQEP
jgi:hypothetical protein